MDIKELRTKEKILSNTIEVLVNEFLDETEVREVEIRVYPGGYEVGKRKPSYHYIDIKTTL